VTIQGKVQVDSLVQVHPPARSRDRTLFPAASLAPVFLLVLVRVLQGKYCRRSDSFGWYKSGVHSSLVGNPAGGIAEEVGCSGTRSSGLGKAGTRIPERCNSKWEPQTKAQARERQAANRSPITRPSHRPMVPSLVQWG
jgi:hypothetical protein